MKLTSLDKLEGELTKIPGMKEAVADERAALRAARFIRETREAANLSQSKLAQELEISQARVSQLEKGKGRYGVSVALLERVAEACGGKLEFKFAKARG
jgi:ribosome-binding protein aMBF1 (putative translation factor)